MTTRPRIDKAQVISFGIEDKAVYNLEVDKFGYIDQQFIIVLSILSNKKGTISLLSTNINHNQSTLKPIQEMDYLLFLNSKQTIDLKIALNKKKIFFMAKFKRVIGGAVINYKHSENNFKAIVESNSTSTQFVLHKEDAEFNIINSYDNYLVLIFRYDENNFDNFDKIDIGPSQNIYYPNIKNGFPIFYYIPLRYVEMDFTFNFQIKNQIYENEETGYEVNDYEIYGLITNENYIRERKNKEITLPSLLGFHLGRYDPSLQTGRVTIPRGTYDKLQYALIIIRPGKIFNRIKSFVMSVLAFPENSLHYNITLPQNNYFYSLMDTNLTKFKDTNIKAGHLYKLSKDSSLDNFIVIELASCLGEVEYALRDIDFNEEILVDKNPSLLLNKTRHTHRSYDHYGKRVIEVSLNSDDKDLVIAVFPRNFIQNIDCDMFKECVVDNNVGYAIRYRSFQTKSSFDSYQIGDRGLISTEYKDDKVLINISSIKDHRNKEVKTKYYYRLFYNSKTERQLSIYESICFAHSTAKVYFSNSYNPNFILANFPTNTEYIVSVLAETIEPGNNDRSLLVYTPIKAIMNTSSNSVWLSCKLLLLTYSLINFHYSCSNNDCFSFIQEIQTN
jgi:hypothetical protein